EFRRVLFRSLLGAGQTRVSPVFSKADVEVQHVIAVEDDFLHIDFRPANSKTMRKGEVLALHGMVSFLVVWSRRLSTKRPIHFASSGSAFASYLARANLL